MRKIELLAPAGDRESLRAAVHNGANAIYLGGTLFNARAFAKNFDDTQIQWAIKYAHARNVKIYVTVNTLYKDLEFNELIKYIDRLYDYQVDALIIQDIGLFSIVKERYPDFEIHMSTQASIMNLHSAQYFEELGASRIVLARENSLKEIENICKDTSIEVEVFVHGALCVCYSGQCLMSSLIGKRSGNQGACAQPCRLQYHLLKDNKTLPQKYPFLLSPKDLMTIESIGDLIDAGVTSFKIEGRMKRPEYVASVVKAYRKAIDAHLNKQKPNLEDDIAYMKAMFNRDYTKGYAFLDTHIVTGDYSGNKGVVIGKVIRYLKKERRVVIELNDSLRQGDSLVFEKIDKGRPVNKIYFQNHLVSKAESGDVVEIEFDYPVYEGLVRKTLDTFIVKELQKSYEKEYRKQSVSLYFEAYIGKKAKLTVRYNDIEIVQDSTNYVEQAQKTALDQQRIHQQLAKLGQYPFVASSIEINIDENLTLPIKDINEMRRGVMDHLMQVLENQKNHHYTPTYLPTLTKVERNNSQDVMILVSNLEQLKIAISFPIDIIYYPFQSDIEEAYHICKNHDKELGIFVPRICKDEDLKEINNHCLYPKIKHMIVNEYGALHAFKDKQLVCGTGLNIYNSYACHYYDNLKILSLEMSKKEMNHLVCDFHQCIVQIYGKIENMISDYCPISQHYFGYQNKNCQLCKQGKYTLKDRKNEYFDLMMDEKCRMHLLNCRTLWFEHFRKLNAKGLFLHFTNENQQTIQYVLEEFYKSFLNLEKTSISQTIETTSAYLKIS